MKGYKVLIEGKPLVEILPKLYETMSVREIAKKYHVSKSSVDSCANKLRLRHNEETEIRLGIHWGKDGKYHRGGKLPGQSTTLQRLVIEHYPTMTVTEIVEKFGVNYRSVSSIAYRLGLKHNEETNKRISASKRPPRQIITEEYRKNQSEKHKKIWRRERWKAINGIKRNEKIRVNLLPSRVKAAKAYLCVDRNYFSDNKIDPWALFYDEQTRRESPHYLCKEADYTEKYGIKFLPADGYKETDTNTEEQK